jgi:ABC-type lipoprotein release transport system permease subunit
LARAIWLNSICHYPANVSQYLTLEELHVAMREGGIFFVVLHLVIPVQLASIFPAFPGRRA